MSVFRRLRGIAFAKQTGKLRAMLAGSVLALASVAPSFAAEPIAELSTYQREGGSTFFALSLTPPAAAAVDWPRDVILLFDTSASQTGAFRENALAAAETFIAKLRPQDRVQIMAADLDARAMTTEFLAANSGELKAALGKLRDEPPLGSTDMEQVLGTALAKFDPARKSGRTMIYIGDGMSQANFLGTDTFRKLVESLTAARVSVSSYALGPQNDARLLAALANHSGGNLYVAEALAAPDAEKGVTEDRAAAENNRRGSEVGAKMAGWVRASVIWPEAITWPAELGEVYPKTLPPLRTDRDTVVVGAAKEPLKSAISLNVNAQGERGAASLKWTATPHSVGDAHAFLAQVVEMASRDGGITLPTVGSAGLAETGRLMSADVGGLTKLAEDAVAMGDLNTANLAANAVLTRDPGNVKALTVQRAAAKRSVAATPVAQTTIAPPEPPVNDPNNLMLVRPSQPAAVAPPTMINDQSVPAPGSLNDRFSPDGSLLDATEQRRARLAQMMRREVENTVIDARRRMNSEPDRVTQDLKLMLQNVERAPELAANVRSQLIDKLQGAIRETQRAAQIKDERDAETQERMAMARENELVQQRLTRTIEREKQLIDRVDTLMDLGSYEEAEVVADLVEDIDPGGVTPRVSRLSARLMRQDHIAQVARAGRWRYYIEALQQVELSSIPYPDEPPIIYPDAEVWRQLTIRRKDRYGAMDLTSRGDAEERIEKALEGPLRSTGMEFNAISLEQVVADISADYGIPIQLDKTALEDAGLGPDEPVTINLHGVSLRSALNHLLRQHALTYIYQDEVLLITTPTVAEEHLTVRVYPVADLVLPIQNLGGGGLGGGLGGGIGGGIGGGGGFGGGGGGFGGGGGGFGGGGGGFGGGGQQGGGGGFFSVPESTDATSAPAADKGTGTATPTNITLTRDASPTALKPNVKPAVTKTTRPIAINETVKPDAFWNEHFSRQTADPLAVRETVRQLMGSKRYDQVIALVHAALRHGQPEPWMYETLGIAMEMAGRPKEQIERAVMSAADFSSSTDELMYVAEYLTRIGIDRRAMKVYQQVAKAEPLRGEAYALALKSAQRCKDLAGIQWATVGVLSQAWPKDQAAIETTAARVARAMLDQLKGEGKTAEYDAYLARIREAVVRDVVVQVSWTGQADIDIAVEEPAGTVCSSLEPRTLAGGVALGDSYETDRETNSVASETYVCPQGFAGTYRVRINRIWGEVAAGKVTVDVYRHLRSGAVQHEQQQISLSENDSMVVFDLDKGRRTEKLEVAKLAGAVQRRQQITQSVLAQQIVDSSDPSAFPVRPNDPATQIARALLARRGAGAVGFMPQITVLPSGTQLQVTGVVSADRRYVRITATPNFTTVGNVQTFTFAGPGEEVDMGMMPMPDPEEEPTGPLNLGGGGFGGR